MRIIIHMLMRFWKRIASMNFQKMYSWFGIHHHTQEKRCERTDGKQEIE